MNSIKEYFRENKPFFVFLFILFIFRSSLADQYIVPSGSMEPTIQVGDRIFVNKMAYDLQIPFTDISLYKTSDPKRGDIVVFTNPKNNITMVKRLIGLPGDEIQIVNGFVWINGQPLYGGDYSGEEHYKETNGEHNYVVQRIPFHPNTSRHHIVVPQGHFYMMGDNRDNSSDSRAWGLVPRSNLLGKAKNVLYSGNFISMKPRVSWERFGMSLYR